MKTNPRILVAYYSRSKNNQFIAQKLASALSADKEAIRPNLNLLPFQLLFSSWEKSLGIKPLLHKPNDYDRIILLGPVWFGKLVSPLREFLNRYMHEIKVLHFVSCCGTPEHQKDEKYGFVQVFQTVKAIMGETCMTCDALPISLILSEELQTNQDAIMKARLTEDSFQKSMALPFEALVQRMKV